MTSILLLAFVAIILGLVLVAATKKRRPGDEDNGTLPYRLGDGLLTPAERSFFGVLEQAVGSDFRIFAKVRVADIISPTRGLPPAERQRALNRINAKHFDFVLCNSGDLKPVCAIELNDKSHEQAARRERDSFLEQVCQTAGLPLIFFPAQRSYTVTDVCQTIAQIVGRRPAGTSVAPNTAEPPTAILQAQSTEPPDAATAPENGPACPKCASPMTRRIAKTGEHAGKEFWGCSRFPACRGALLS